MKNIGNYLHDAFFETEVYPNVYWVPLNVLGKTSYSTEDVMKLKSASPEEKRSKIRNLYEAIQLFQLSEFAGVLDNTDSFHKNMLWQTHKCGRDAVLSNEGCCATDTNWLAYLLEGKYDSMGSFCYANTDGNGHITTYIMQDGFYYFIDMMMCRADSQSFFGEESGKLDDLLRSEWAGFLFKCKDPLDFCRFNIERLSAKKRAVPFCFYMRDVPYVSATGLRIEENRVVFCVPACDQPRIIYLDAESGCNLEVILNTLNFIS